MPMEAQTRLLRVLQEGEYTTVGGRTPIKTNVRIIAATNKDLGKLISQGLFREDLYYRLNVVPIRLPPLRERTDDIAHLVSHFFARPRRKACRASRSSRSARAAAALSLAGQCPRTGEPRPASGGALSEEIITEQTIEAELDEPATVATGGPARRDARRLGRTAYVRLLQGVRRQSAAAGALSPDSARDGRAADRRGAWRRRGAIRSGPRNYWASTATPCARKSATSRSR